MLPKVAIIILNWNGWEDTLECLESLYQLNYPNYQIVVADNFSEDESLKRIREYCDGQIRVKSPLVDYRSDKKPLKIHEYSEDVLDKDPIDPPAKTELVLLKNSKNHGFAKGNNLAVEFALRAIKPDYFLLLNNDTVVDSHLLDELINAADEQTGCLGPKIYYYDYQGRTDVLSFTWERINFFTSLGKRCGKDQVDQRQCDHNHETDKVEGCSMLLKREVVEQLGLFDPIYFAYWEETDLCQRIKKAGWKLVYVPEARMWHKVGMQWENYFSYFVIYHYLVRNRLIFMWRYTSALQKAVFTIYFIFYLLANLVVMLITQNRKTSRKGLKAVKDGLNDFWAL
ncbi:MAG TPA: glycosyltransferase family 2 protein [Methanobacteriaceae archaeon]|nr:glycosyltransferase family 2 protein [Methanobacteriaceae archaeon]